MSLDAYNRGCVDAYEKSNEYKSLGNGISVDSLFYLMKNHRWLNVSSLKFGDWEAPIIYLIVRELSNRGCEAAKRQFEVYNDFLGI